jgi:thiamine biosynthesis lipoprotein
MTTVTLARNAMATRFEAVLHGADAAALRAAGEEALSEIERIEAQLSLYQPASEIAHLNARAARGPVKVSPALFRLLERAAALHRETDGAFDITIGPLMRCWGFVGGTGRLPEPAALAEARARVGMGLVELNARDFTVRFAREGVILDLGALGKGYAIEEAAGLLRETGVTSALLHGGTSSVHALGRTPEGEPWKVAIEKPPLTPREARYRTPIPNGGENTPNPFAPDAPEQRSGAPASGPARRGRQNDAVPEAGAPVQGDTGQSSELLAVVPLENESLSVSAVWGKSFQSGDKTLGHVLDPRTGQPSSNAVLAAVVTPSATEGDALSTALLTLGAAGLDAIQGLRPGMRCLVMTLEEGVATAHRRGLG